MVEKNTDKITILSSSSLQLSEQLHIMRLGVQHVELLMPVAKQAYIEHYEHLWHDAGKWYLEKSFSAARLTTELADPGAVFFLIMLQNAPVGFIKINIDAPRSDDPDGNGMELERIYIIRSASGKGIGTQLLQLTFRLAKEKQKDYVWLKAMDTSTGAIAFYIKQGFTMCGAFRLDYTAMKEECRGMVIMKKVL